MSIIDDLMVSASGDPSYGRSGDPSDRFGVWRPLLRPASIGLAASDVPGAKGKVTENEEWRMENGG